jgi:5-methylcytosine-specific restriction endonuclease McrA
MPRVKVRMLGGLRFSEEGGLQYSVSLKQPPNVPASVLDYEALVREPRRLLTDPSELMVGDFVVHAHHGVARYEGVQRLSREDGNKGEFLCLEYAGNVRLYVPMERIDLVQKYMGSTPNLNRLVQPGKEYKHEATYWLEALPNAYEWPNLGTFPELTKAANRIEWRCACDAYKHALHADPKYQEVAMEFLERQRREPQPLLDLWWAFRDKVLGLESTEPEGLRNRETDLLLVKHYVLRQERNYERVRREVEAMENLKQLAAAVREPIPESVRLYVWQRDRGQCVKCGSRERLEFDHIIPIIAGGSNTDRNIQLLCESCNRAKGATV